MSTKDLPLAGAKNDRLIAKIRGLEKQFVEAIHKIGAVVEKTSSPSKSKKRVEAKVLIWNRILAPTSPHLVTARLLRFSSGVLSTGNHEVFSCPIFWSHVWAASLFSL